MPSPSPSSSPAQALRGGLLMSAGMGCFILNDTFTKLLAGRLDTGELIVLRGLFASAVMVVMVIAAGQAPALVRLFSPAVLARTVLDAFATLLFITALFHMPLPNITAIMQAVPLTATVLAAVFLGEAVGWRRLTAIVAGFMGVLMIVRPGGEGFNAYALLAVCCVLTVAVRDIITRRIPADIPSLVVALGNALFVTLAGAGLAVFQGFGDFAAADVGLVVLASVFLVGGYLATVMAVRAADVAWTAPFRYTIIVWSLMLGYFVFGEVPGILSFVGIGLIAGSGLYTLFRERALERERAAELSPSARTNTS